MNLEDPASPGGGQAPKKIEAYQCNLCPAVFGFKFNAKRHFQKLHPEDEYDGSKIANIKFKCYGCQWGLDTYGNLEAHFAQNHQGQVLNPEKVYLGDTQTTAATFQSVKRMKTPSKRKRPAESLSRPSSASGAMQHPGPPTMSSPQHHVQHVQPLPGQQQQPPLVPHSHMMMAHSPMGSHSTGGNPTPPAAPGSVSTYQGDLLCNSCEFTCDNPQSLALHQQTHTVQPSHYGNQQNHEQQQMQSHQPQSGYNYPGAPHHGNNGAGSDLFMDFKVEEENLQHQYNQQQHQMYHQQQQPYHGHSAQQQQQHPYPSSEQGYQQQHQGYHGQPHPHQGYGSYNNHQMPHQYQQQQYHHYSHMQQHVPPPHAPTGQHGHQQQPLPPEHHIPTPPPTTILSPPLSTPSQNQYQAPTPPHQQPPPQYQEVPHPHYQQHTPPPPPHQQAPLPQQQQPMINPNNNSNSSNNSSPYHELDQKIIETEALRNQNGNGGETPPLSHHHFHDLYPPNQNSPRQQNGATSAANNNIGGNGPYSNATSGGAGGAYSPAASPAPAVGGPKQRRTNIGKMFPTHICYLCDSRLAKLDCIKMHFKNKHVETPLDLNKVMITRVCCYLCGVRKKEYAILVRHFQVEHKDQPLDPFRIGMDEPTPFNLSPEAEAELQRLPIPDPVKHDPVKHRQQTGPPKGGPMNNDHDQRQLYGQGQHGQQQFSTLPIPDENTLDSIGDEYTPPNHVMKEDTTATGGNGMEPLQDHHPGPMLDSGGNGGSGATIMKKKRRFNQAFKNNKCTACGKAFSRMTTAKKHFLDQHPTEMPFDKTKIEVTQLPCYLCDTLITDSRHALRHFETSHPGIDYDSRQVQVSGIELTNGDDLDESTEDLEANNSLAFSSASEADIIDNHQMANSSSSRGSGPPNGGQADRATPKSGFRCFLCNYWCSTIEDFQVHFAPETKAHENVSEVTITCPVCMHKCETTEEMFDHLSNEHSTYDSLSKLDTEEDESAVSSGQSADSTASADQQLTSSARVGQTETAVGSSVNSVNSCVETC